MNTPRFWRPALLALAVLMLPGVASAQDKLKLRTTYFGHRSAVFSADGARLAACTAKDTATVWRLGAKDEGMLLVGHNDTINDVAFSPDGKWVATGGNDESSRLWDLATGKTKFTFHVGESQEFNGTYAVFAVGFSPDSKLLATAGRDAMVHLWDVDTGKRKKGLPHEKKIHCIAFNQTGELLATGDMTGMIRIWDVAKNKVQRVFSQQGAVLSVAFSNDGQHLVSGGTDINAHLWDLTTGKKKGELPGHNGRIRTVAFSPDSQTIATGSDDKTFKLWDVASRRYTKSVSGREIHCVTFSPDGKLLATVGVENLGDPHTVQIYEVGAGASASR